MADVIAHELAHMWFGDLVTMGWWEGIWLNEAFATFMETLCVDAFRPSWDRWVGFAPSREAALAVDAVHATRPIEYPVGPPKEAEGMFDLLTYEKGCGVLRMLEQYIGPEVFRDGVRTYLKAHAYGNTVTTDLWDALEDASGAPVRDVMDTFILQGGHPLVSLRGDTLDQQPFSLGPVPDGTDVVHRRRRGTCRSPCAALPSDGSPATPARNLVLEHRARSVIDEAAQGLAVVNAGGWGMFRVGYERRAPPGPGRPLSELTPLERANLLADTWATTLAGHSTPRGFLILAAQLGLEPDPAPWAPVASCPALVRAHRRREPTWPRCTEAVAALIGPPVPPPRLRRPAGRGRAHADAALARHQPPGHRRRGRRRAGRGGPPLRRLAHRRWPGEPDPGRRGGGHPGRGGPAAPARRLRRAAWSATGPPRRRRRRCAPSARSPPSRTSTCACARSTWP